MGQKNKMELGETTQIVPVFLTGAVMCCRDFWGNTAGNFMLIQMCEAIEISLIGITISCHLLYACEV